jgi:hypothetical protein
MRTLPSFRLPTWPLTPKARTLVKGGDPGTGSGRLVLRALAICACVAVMASGLSAVPAQAATAATSARAATAAAAARAARAGPARVDAPALAAGTP